MFSHRIIKDYLLLTAGIIAVFLVISGWQTYETFLLHEQSTQESLEKQVLLIEKELTSTFRDGLFFIDHVNRELPQTEGDLEKMRLILRAYNTESYGFGFTDTNYQYRIGTQLGILKEPIDVSDRHYVKEAMTNPDQVFFGELIVGRASNWGLIPISKGILDNQGNLMGVVTAYIRAEELTKRLEKLALPGVGFLINGINNAEIGTVSSDFLASDYRVTRSLSTPDGKAYEIHAGYNSELVWQRIMVTLLPRLAEYAVVSISLIAMLFFLRRRIVQPAVQSVREKETMEKVMAAKAREICNQVHDLKTPLNSVIGYSEMVKHGLHGPLDEKYREYADGIHKMGHYLCSLVDEILDINRSKAGALELQIDKTDIEALIRQTLNCFDLQARAKGIVLAADIRQAPALYVDAKRFKRVLQNLLSNAVKFTRKDGSVQVEYFVDAQMRPTIRVTDTGIGMNEEELSIALSEYGQVREAQLSEHNGSGLGLPFARRITEEHGAQFLIRSAKGEGTTVTLVFDAHAMRPPGTPRLSLVVSNG